MKKAALFIVALFTGAATLVTMTSYVNHPSLVSINPGSALAQGEPIHITFNRNAARTFTTHGAITSYGTWSMAVTSTGSAFHCINTLTSTEGTLVAISHCNNITMNGVWQIVSGTGIFADLKGNGKLQMLSYGEEWEGTVR